MSKPFLDVKWQSFGSPISIWLSWKCTIAISKMSDKYRTYSKQKHYDGGFPRTRLRYLSNYTWEGNARHRQNDKIRQNRSVWILKGSLKLCFVFNFFLYLWRSGNIILVFVAKIGGLNDDLTTHAKGDPTHFHGWLNIKRT